MQRLFSGFSGIRAGWLISSSHKGPSPQVLTLFGGVRFTAWRLRRPSLGECRRGPRHFWSRWVTALRPDPPKNGFVSHSAVWWDVRQISSLISDWQVLTLYITTMASLVGYQLSLVDPDFVDTWLRCFTASTRTKKLKHDREKKGENQITDIFLATAGCEMIMKLSTIA